MSDPIDRKKAIDAIANLTFNVTIGGKRGFQDYKKEVEKIFVAIRDKYIEALKALPPAEPEKGEWIYVKKRLARGGYVDASECSVCHKIIFPYVNMNYCPYCGARMNGGGKNAIS